MQLAEEIPRVFAGASDLEEVAGSTPTAAGNDEGTTDVNLEPELRSSSQRHWTTVDIVLSVTAVKLHLYDAFAFSDLHLKDHGIVRFALNDNTLRFKLLSDGAREAQVVLRSFTMGNTRPGNTKFREIIPAAQHDRNQFMLLYTMSGSINPSSLALLTVDSPQVIFAIDPVISLLEFFTSITSQRRPPPSPSIPQAQQHISGESQNTDQNQGTLDFRLDLHDVSVSVLENDTESDSRAIRLYINQILLSQQVRNLYTLKKYLNMLYMTGNSGLDCQSIRDVPTADGKVF
jgi:vacuolar protein sorting-associated protein 13A/C